MIVCVLAVYYSLLSLVFNHVQSGWEREKEEGIREGEREREKGKGERQRKQGENENRDRPA